MDIEQLKSLAASDPWRLHYHIMPESGWLNDPNGAIQFQGIYHIYYQYVPEDATGGATHWGHMTSEDMVHFQQEAIFMSPDQDFDKDGVYSGSAIEMDGQLHYFYTGNVKHEGDYDYIFNGREQNVVHVVSEDGYIIKDRQVVIGHDDFVAGYTDHIRDPKVFERNGLYYMILGARSETNKGSILVYKSEDLANWVYEGTLLEGDEDQGYMWECPDFLDLNGQSLLILSPQGIMEETYQFNNPHAATYLIGKTDWNTLKFYPETEFKELDRGFDFYAPHTFLDDQGRRIMWSWMGIGDTMPEYTNPTVARGWQHAMALPRELIIEDGQLYQRPLDEYKKLRQNEIRLAIEKMTPLTGEIYELMIEFNESDPFVLNLRQDSQLIYDGELLTLRHGKSGYGRRTRVTPIEEIRSIQVYVDTSSMEFFINDGSHVLTSRVYPELGQDKIELITDATGIIRYWDLIKV